MQDLAALAAPVIVCVAFLIGTWLLVRRELGPKRRRRAEGDGGPGTERQHEPGERSER